MTGFINKSSSDFYDLHACNIGKDFIVDSNATENLSTENKKRTVEIIDTDKKIKIIAHLEFDIESFLQLDKITELVSNKFNIRGTAIMSPKALKTTEKIETMRELISETKLPRLEPSGPTTQTDREKIKEQQQHERALIRVGEAILDIKRELDRKHNNDSESIIPPKKDTIEILKRLFLSYPACRYACITELNKRGPMPKDITNSDLAERLFDEKNLISYLVSREDEKQREIERKKASDQPTEGSISAPLPVSTTSTTEQKTTPLAVLEQSNNSNNPSPIEVLRTAAEELEENDNVLLDDAYTHPELKGILDDNDNSVQFSGQLFTGDQLEENDNVLSDDTHTYPELKGTLDDNNDSVQFSGQLSTGDELEENDTVLLDDTHTPEPKRTLDDNNNLLFSGQLSTGDELEENDTVLLDDTHTLEPKRTLDDNDNLLFSGQLSTGDELEENDNVLLDDTHTPEPKGTLDDASPNSEEK